MIEIKYTLAAEMFYNGRVRRVSPMLTDTLSALFLVVSKYKYVVLVDAAGQFLVTRPTTWLWGTRPISSVLTVHIPIETAPTEPKVFDTLEQALTYLDCAGHLDE